MDMSSRLEQLHKSFENRSDTIASLFESRMDILSENLFSFFEQSFTDDTAVILAESPETRAFVVDRILEVVCDKFDSEKETSILKLMRQNKALSEQLSTLQDQSAITPQLNEELQAATQEIQRLKESLSKNENAKLESIVRLQSEKEGIQKQLSDVETKLQQSTNELNLKVEELGSKTGEWVECEKDISELKEQLSKSNTELAQIRNDSDRISAENSGLLREADQLTHEVQNQSDMIHKLRTTLMTSETERLALRQQYMEIGGKLQILTQTQQQHMESSSERQNVKDKKISDLRAELHSSRTELSAIKTKLQKHTYEITLKLEQKVERVKSLDTDVAALKAQLQSERKVSEMYNKEIQDLKLALRTKEVDFEKIRLDYSRDKSDTIHTEHQKANQHYQKVVNDNMEKMREDFNSRVTKIREEYNDTVSQMYSLAEVKFSDAYKKLESRHNTLTKEYESTLRKKAELEQLNIDYQTQIAELSLNIDATQHKNEKLEYTLRSTQSSKQSELSERDSQLKEYHQSIAGLETKKILLEKQLKNLSSEKQQLQSITTTERQSFQSTASEFRRSNQVLQSKLTDTERRLADGESNAEYLQIELDKEVKKNADQSIYARKLYRIQNQCKGISLQIYNHKNQLTFFRSYLKMYFTQIEHEMQLTAQSISTKANKIVSRRNDTIQSMFAKNLETINSSQRTQMMNFREQVTDIISNYSSPEKQKSPPKKKKTPEKKTLSIQTQPRRFSEEEMSELLREVGTVRTELRGAQEALSPRTEIIVSPFTHKIAHRDGNSLPEPFETSPIYSPKRVTFKEPRKAESGNTVQELRDDLEQLEISYRQSLQSK